MSRFHRMRQRVRDHAGDERGSITIEAVFLLPLVIWVYVAGFVFFDAFRVVNTNAKAAYVVADLLTRRNDAVDADFLEGLNRVYDFLARSRHPTTLRVSRIEWDDELEEYRLRWSHGTRTKPALTPEGLAEVSDRLPDIVPGDMLILVETGMAFEPILPVGIEGQMLEHFMPVRPRFGPNLNFVGAGS